MTPMMSEMPTITAVTITGPFSTLTMSTCPVEFGPIMATINSTSIATVA